VVVVAEEEAAAGSSDTHHYLVTSEDPITSDTRKTGLKLDRNSFDILVDETEYDSGSWEYIRPGQIVINRENNLNVFLMPHFKIRSDEIRVNTENSDVNENRSELIREY
jgi:hypothetical protein